ncbi:MAG: FtsW/RodA/SpoVE family cell cycle protein, partial [Candidatus Shapirobacteria bacterium]|nr:FtsW/RodA/SpoVE family cell cycle protein [Candidatus Shapirobacteria bacterium]
MKTIKSPLTLLVFCLITIGLVFISISSLNEATLTLGDKFFFLRKQIIWLFFGIISFIIGSKTNINLIKKIAFPFYLFSLLCLILVLIPGLSNETLGAHRWLNLGIFSFQPSELLKLSSVIYFSHLFSSPQKRNLKNLIIYLSIPFFLIILQPNLSSAILITIIIISIYYLAGGEIIPLFGLSSFFVLVSFIFVITSPYRMARLKTLLNPNDNQNTSSYHSNQIILGLSSGGFFGKGLANSDQKYRFLPKISTDSILAIIGEETGFLGISLILIIYVVLISYLFKLSAVIKDPFSASIVAGASCWIAYQSLINIAAIASIIPLTGIPLPFISYGGSSILTLLFITGLVKNIEKQSQILLYSNNESSKTIKKNHHHRN